MTGLNPKSSAFGWGFTLYLPPQFGQTRYPLGILPPGLRFGDQMVPQFSHTEYGLLPSRSTFVIYFTLDSISRLITELYGSCRTSFKLSSVFFSSTGTQITENSCLSRMENYITFPLFIAPLLYIYKSAEPVCIIPSEVI